MDFFCCLRILGQTPKQAKISERTPRCNWVPCLQASESQQGGILPPKTIWQCLETYLVVTPQGERKLLVPSEQEAGTWLSILKCTALPPQTNKDLIQSVNNAIDQKLPLGFKKKNNSSQQFYLGQWESLMESGKLIKIICNLVSKSHLARWQGLAGHQSTGVSWVGSREHTAP